MENGSYARLRNVSLSYNFTAIDFVKSIGIKTLRAYVAGENLVTITKYTGYAPDLNIGASTPNNPATQGLDFGVYPLARTITVGLNVGF